MKTKMIFLSQNSNFSLIKFCRGLNGLSVIPVIKKTSLENKEFSILLISRAKCYAGEPSVMLKNRALSHILVFNGSNNLNMHNV